MKSRVKLDQELAFDSARFIAFHIWNSAGKTLKRSFDRVDQVWKFPWDQEHTPKKQTPEEMKAILLGIAFHQNSRIDKQERRKNKGKTQ
jgi:hypothetical protein